MYNWFSTNNVGIIKNSFMCLLLSGTSTFIQCLYIVLPNGVRTGDVHIIINEQFHYNNSKAIL